MEVAPGLDVEGDEVPGGGLPIVYCAGSTRHVLSSRLVVAVLLLVLMVLVVVMSTVPLSFVSLVG